MSLSTTSAVRRAPSHHFTRLSSMNGEVLCHKSPILAGSASSDPLEVTTLTSCRGLRLERRRPLVAAIHGYRVCDCGAARDVTRHSLAWHHSRRIPVVRVARRTGCPDRDAFTGGCRPIATKPVCLPWTWRAIVRSITICGGLLAKGRAGNQACSRWRISGREIEKVAPGRVKAFGAIALGFAGRRVSNAPERNCQNKCHWHQSGRC